MWFKKDKMINFRRDDKTTISLSFDEVGLTEIVEELREAKIDNSDSIKVKFDKSITTMKKKSPTKRMGLIFLRGKSNEMRVENRMIVWEFTEKDLSSALTRFEACQMNEEFLPAELLRVNIENSRQLDQIMCELIL